MAARKKKQQTKTTIERIKAGLLMYRLELHALSDEEIMTSSQIRAAEILLKKVVPDMTHTTGEVVHSVADDITARMTAAKEKAARVRLQ